MSLGTENAAAVRRTIGVTGPAVARARLALHAAPQFPGWQSTSSEDVPVDEVDVSVVAVPLHVVMVVHDVVVELISVLEEPPEMNEVDI